MTQRPRQRVRFCLKDWQHPRLVGWACMVSTAISFLLACQRERIEPRYPEGVWLEGGPTRGASLPMGEMDRPPPRWTANETIGSVSDLGKVGELGDACEKLESILRRAGFSDKAILAIGDDGFAILTRAERIDEDGRSRRSNDRFSVEDNGYVYRPVTLANWFNGLFNRDPGRFRFFVFAVTPNSLFGAGRGTDASWRRTREIYSQGVGHLPPELANRKVAPTTPVTVLIYEFQKAAQDEPPTLVTDSRLQAREHLIAAGLPPVLRGGL